MDIVSQELVHKVKKNNIHKEKQIYFHIKWYKDLLLKCKYMRNWYSKKCMLAESLQSCPTVCDRMDCSPPGSSVHGILQARNTGVDCHVLLQGIFLTLVSYVHLLPPALAGRFFTTTATWEAHQKNLYWQLCTENKAQNSPVVWGADNLTKQSFVVDGCNWPAFTI